MNRLTEERLRSQYSIAAFEGICHRIANNDESLVEMNEWSKHNVCLEWNWRQSDLLHLGLALQHNTHLQSIRFLKTSGEALLPQTAHEVCLGLASCKLSKLQLSGAVSWPLQRYLHQGVAASQTIQTLEYFETTVFLQSLSKVLTIMVGPSSSTNTSMLLLPSLTNLSIASCGLDDLDMLTLTLGLVNNRQVRSLWLPRNHITNIGAMYFCQHWREDSPLELLELSDNEIGVEGALTLLQESARHPAFGSLLLGCNGRIGKEGLQRIGQILPQASRLQRLDIYDCVGVSYKTNVNTLESVLSAFALADGLRRHTSLRALNVGISNLGPNGALAILQAVADHPTMEKLTIEYDHSIGFRGLVQMGQFLAEETTLMRLKELVLEHVVPSWPQTETKEARLAGRAMLDGVRNTPSLERFQFDQMARHWLDPIQEIVEINKTCPPLFSNSEVITHAVWAHVLAQFGRQRRHKKKNKTSHLFVCLREQPWLVCVNNH